MQMLPGSPPVLPSPLQNSRLLLHFQVGISLKNWAHVVICPEKKKTTFELLSNLSAVAMENAPTDIQTELTELQSTTLWALQTTSQLRLQAVRTRLLEMTQHNKKKTKQKVAQVVTSHLFVFNP